MSNILNSVDAAGGRGGDDSVWASGRIDDASALSFCKALQAASSANSREPIVVYINTSGGEADAGMSMISAMDAVPNKIITVVMGKAFSFGAVLLSHGDLRFVSPYSRIMIHEVLTTALWGNVNDVLADSEELSRVNDRILDLLATNCKMKRAELQKRFAQTRDIYLTPKEAVAFGVADKIGIPTISTNVEYRVSS